MITKIKLKNIGPHHDREFNFKSGLTAIVGSNGSGKSTIINGLYAAMTGDFSRLRVDVKTDIISGGVSESSSSYIDVWGVKNGEEFYLRRAVRGTSSFLEVSGGKYSKSQDIRDQLDILLGVSKKILEHHVFVAQGKMFDFLLQTEAERLKLFQYLCGLEITSEIRKACVDFLKRHQPTVVIDNRPDMELKIAEAKQEKKLLLNDIGSLESELITSTEKERLTSLIKSRRDYVEYLKRKKDLDQVKDSLAAGLEVAVRKVDSCQSELEDLEADPLSAEIEKEEEYRKIGFDHAKYSTKEEAKETCRVLKKMLDSLAERYKESVLNLSALSGGESLSHLLQEEKRELSVELGKVAEWERILKSVGDKSKCGSCGQTIDENHRKFIEKKLKLSKDVVKGLEDVIEEKEEQIDRLEEAKSEVEDTQEEIERLVKDYEAKVELAKKAPSSQSVTRAENMLNRIVKYKTKLAAERRELQTEKNNLKSMVDQFEAIKSRRVSKVEKVSKEDSEQAESSLEANRSVSNQILRLRAQVESLDKTIKNLKEIISSIGFKLAENERNNTLLTTVEEVSDVMHWGALPRSVSQRKLESLIGSVNQNLALFGSPFYVEADENLSFKVFFPSGLVVRGKQLSPGQAVVLSIAFRLALSELFQSNIEMMFLDEPTANLDYDNISFLRSAISEATGKLGSRQLVIVTHEADLASIAPNLISLG